MSGTISLEQPVALAREALEEATIQNLDFSPRIGDGSPFLQPVCGIRDGGAAHAQHLGQQLLF